MTQVVYSRRALSHAERAFEHIAEHNVRAAMAAATAIRSAVEILEQHPLIGRPRGEELRELVISYGASGYVALYRYAPARDEVRVLAIKNQRELDYPL